MGNVTGSNAVNVFLGLGMPWLAATIYWAGVWDDKYTGTVAKPGVCRYLCMKMYTCIYMFMSTYILNLYIHTYMQIYTHKNNEIIQYTCMHMYMYMCIYIHTYKYTDIQTNKHTCMHMYMFTWLLSAMLSI